jgi:ribosomal protein S18 acetylase RimI-like enzyme
MNIFTKQPSECSEDELAQFEALVLEGGEVTPQGLSERIKKAKNLIFVRDETSCIAIGALKRPNENYKNDVFQKAGVPKLLDGYPFEIGWIYASPSARGKGVGKAILKVIADILEESGCFATTRQDNEVMHHLFEQYSFLRLGNEYPSNNGNYHLILYGYKP